MREALPCRLRQAAKLPEVLGRAIAPAFTLTPATSPPFPWMPMSATSRPSPGSGEPRVDVPSAGLAAQLPEDEGLCQLPGKVAPDRELVGVGSDQAACRPSVADVWLGRLGDGVQQVVAHDGTISSANGCSSSLRCWRMVDRVASNGVSGQLAFRGLADWAAATVSSFEKTSGWDTRCGVDVSRSIRPGT